MIEFTPWQKIARLNRDITITEKIDGTNGAVGVVEYDPYTDIPDCAQIVGSHLGDCRLLVYAQSRSRIITPDMDNHGFAKWVWDHAQTLALELGPGLHFGEWWGYGIQGRYNSALQKGERHFSLFNTKRWEHIEPTVPEIGVVPILYQGPFGPEQEEWPKPWEDALENLRTKGSIAAPGCTNPEGIVIYHHAASQLFKVTLANDEEPKEVTRRRLVLAA